MLTRKKKVIRVDNVSKSYAGKSISLFWNQIFNTKVKGSSVLTNITFNVKKGSCFGVLGMNGAGKSTLLQLLTGILTPTRGRIEIEGKATAILELGSGFVDHFTGEENIELYSHIMGFSSSELAEHINEIKAFAELGEYYKKPIKTYSSGMVARLAFSVRAFLNFDILIIDEVLAVGDSYFQRKCLRLLDKMKDQGKTIIFVSHNINQILEICDEAILLSEGELVYQGKPKECVFNYYNIINNKKIAKESNSEPKKKNSKSFGNGGAELLGCYVNKSEKKDKFFLQFGERIFMTFEILINDDLNDASFGIVIRSVSGIVITGKNESLGVLKKSSIIKVRVSLNCLMNPGNYFLSCGLKSLVKEDSIFQFRNLDFQELEVFDKNLENSTQPYNGMVALINEIQVQI